jgi:hypothetical protein
MNQRANWPIVNKIMVAAMAPFAVVVALDLVILTTTRMFFPGTAGGGDALLMVFLPLLGYLLACVLLVPCLAYLTYQMWKRRVPPPAVQQRLMCAAVIVVAGPPIVINLLPLFR